MATPLKPVGLFRWLWRQLTSMRTALFLLLFLALAAIPGSAIPQLDTDSIKATQWQERNPKLTPWFEKFDLFSVYSSPWFSAIYLLLMISLVGCVIPRLLAHYRGWRAKPTAAPNNWKRHQPQVIATDLPSDQVISRADHWLRQHGYRTLRGQDGVAAEAGYLREFGNLLFHLSLLFVLCAVAFSFLFGFKGGTIVVANDGFSNTITQYDDFAPGGLFTPADLNPFEFKVTGFNVDFIQEGRSAGAAKNFVAELAVRQNGKTETKKLRVNHPLNIGGTDVFLIGHGYAPVFRVRDGAGRVAYQGATVFLPQDQNFNSFGVIKVPDAQPTQLGFEGQFYPTYGFTNETGPFSAFPEDKNPAVSLLPYQGDLGLNSGKSQSVYALDKTDLQVINKAPGKPARIDLPLGGKYVLPKGLGSVEFVGLQKFIRVQISRQPGDWLALLGMVVGLVGLMLSLFVKSRRIWVRVHEGQLQIAGIDRTRGEEVIDVAKLVAELQEKK